MVLGPSGVARVLGGGAGGATRAAITQHQARANNISDVAAKDGSQETLVNLAALMVNLAVLPWLGEDSFGEAKLLHSEELVLVVVSAVILGKNRSYS